MPERRKLFIHELNSVLESAPDGFIVADIDGNILLFNQAALNMHGFTTMEEALVKFHTLEPQFIVTDIVGEHLPVDEWPLARLIRGEYFRDYVYQLTRVDNGHSRWISCSGSLARGDDVIHTYVVLTIVDITSRKAAEDMVAVLRGREKRIATELQDALVPPFNSNIPGLSVTSILRPALDEATIGGDFYDIFNLDNTHYAFVVGDVSGKGLAAAAEIATTRHMLRALLYSTLEVGSAVTELNAILYDYHLLSGFVTCFAAVFNTQTKELMYTSCGHEPAIKVGASTPPEPLNLAGPPLGVLRDAYFEVFCNVLQPGDTVMVCTDGLSECGISRLASLGTEGLMKILEDIDLVNEFSTSAEQILQKASDFSQGQFHDDICIVLFKSH